MKHKHAELMMQYAQDAMETDKPWELWEYSHASSNGWRNLDKMPSWRIGNDYRRKPKMLSVTLANGEVVSWPEPHKTELNYNDVYYTISSNCDALQMQWGAVENDNGRLKMGSVHLTKEAAEQHSYALFKINNQVAK